MILAVLYLPPDGFTSPFLASCSLIETALRTSDVVAGHPDLERFVLLQASFTLSPTLVDRRRLVRMHWFLAVIFRKVLVGPEQAWRSSNPRVDTFYLFLLLNCLFYTYFVLFSDHFLDEHRLMLTAKRTAVEYIFLHSWTAPQNVWSSHVLFGFLIKSNYGLLWGLQVLSGTCWMNRAVNSWPTSAGPGIVRFGRYISKDSFDIKYGYETDSWQIPLICHQQSKFQRGYMKIRKKYTHKLRKHWDQYVLIKYSKIVNWSNLSWIIYKADYHWS